MEGFFIWRIVWRRVGSGVVVVVEGPWEDEVVVSGVGEGVEKEASYAARVVEKQRV